MNFFHLHLVSDSTGETVSSVARATLAQFEGVEVEEHSWSLIRTKGQVDKALEGIRRNPGFVMYTMADKSLRRYFKDGCSKINVPCTSVLAKVVYDLSNYLDIEATTKYPGKQHELDEEYFSRVEAINFALSHDDGQSVWDLEEAEIVLVGVSRTSKSPTSMYLAFRGYRSANVPYVPTVPLPDVLFKLKKPLIVGLTISAEVLLQIRKNRLLSINSSDETSYTDMEIIKEELALARKLFTKYNWPVIDVTRRSVEETSANIIQHYQTRKEQQSALAQRPGSK